MVASKRDRARGGLRERKKDEQRERLYAAALKLFRRRGYEATSVQQIAAAAAAAKGTFFNYFPTKEDILVEYHRRMGREILDALRDRSYATARAAVADALRECAVWALDDPAIGRIIVRVFFGSTQLMESDRANEAALAEWMAAHVTRGVQRGELRDDLDVGLFLSLVFGTLSATMLEWVAGDRAFDLEGTIERKLELVFEGVESQAPRAPRSTQRRS